MIASLYSRWCDRFPRFRGFSRRVMYQFMAKRYQKADWAFMNYGYAALDEEPAAKLELNPRDEINRYCIQLYEHVIHGADLRGHSVLEVGSGRGGGADYVYRYHHPKRVVGLDFSDRAVALCRRHFSGAGLSFVPGNAESLPFDESSFDAVVNVESSHCYPSMPAFLAEVWRVLKPGGRFLFADFRPRAGLAALAEQLAGSRLSIVSQRDITRNVVKALDHDGERRQAHILRGAPGWLVRLVREFAGTQGTAIYRRLQSGEAVYQSFVLQKA